MNKIINIIGVFFVAILSVSSSSALSCMQTTLEQDLKADYVFVATVKNVVEVKDNSTITTQPSRNLSFANINIESQWKGSLPQSMQLYNLYPWPFEGQPSFFKESGKYIVFAYKNEGKLTASLDCGRTSVYSQKMADEINSIIKSVATSTSMIKKCEFANLNNAMWYGNRNNKDDVYNLQKYLFNHYGVDNSNSPTGYYGKVTKDFVYKFQKENGIAPTGNFGNVTMKKVRELCGLPTPTPIKPGFCTKEYKPVCGQPKFSCTGGLNCPMVMPKARTYANICLLKSENTDYLYEGSCKEDVENGEAPATCKVWHDGCNTCSRLTVGGPLMCTKMACFQNSGAKCKEYFSDNTSVAPVISSFSGPVKLSVGETGVWKIIASISDNSQLTYDISWGDEILFREGLKNAMAMFNLPIKQNTSFEHIYKNPGTYTVAVTVTSAAAKSVKSTQSVVVENGLNCMDGGISYKEGTQKQCLNSGGGQACIADAIHVCRNGVWKIEGGLPIRY